MAVSNVAILSTDFNVSPYYDDYDESKYYYRILYKPGYAVQARELTQMQTILQKQIDRFGKHIFRDGSIVLPGQFNIETTIPYVKIKDLDSASQAVEIENYKSYVVTGQTTGITAKIEEVVDGFETTDNSKTIYVSYLTGSTDGSTSVFQPGEILTSNIGTLVVATSVPTGAAPITGIGSRFVISSGVVFAKEHFIYFDTSSIILGRYTQLPSARVGFYISEDIIKYSDDISLLDPALESSNYAAPGADRLKLTPTLMLKNFNDQGDDPDFVELFSIKNGVITETYERPQYSVLRDELAKQKFDESGDYYVQGLGVRVRENLKTAINGGLLATGNNQLLSVGIEPGVGYVKGYEVNKIITEYIDVEKGNDFETIESQITSATLGSYIITNEVIGSVDLDKGTTVSLYDIAGKRVSNSSFDVSTTPSGNNIGSAKVLHVEYNSGLLGSNAATTLVYLTDISMNGTNSFSRVKSLHTTGFGADIVLNSANNAVINDAALSALLYYTGSNFTKTIRDDDGNPRITFNFKRTTSVSDITQLSGYGSFDVVLNTTNIDEQLPYGTTTLSDPDKSEIILSLTSTANIQGQGTVSGSNYTLTSSGNFFSRFNVGDKITIAGKSDIWTIKEINGSGTTITTNELLSAGITGNVYFKHYKAGDIIDLRSKGFDNGEERQVSATPSTLTFDLKETFPGTIGAKVSYQIVRRNSYQANKLLRKNRFVIINCNTAGVTGPFSLGFSDVYKVNAIYKKSSVPTDGDKGTVVTSSFIINNGQKDGLYDTATITPAISLAATDYLLVDLDYFEPLTSVGVGYFSIDSYPIDDDNSPSENTIRTENIPIYSSSTGKRYDLRNYLDFRPVKQRTANDSTTVAGASTNPAKSTTFIVNTNGLRLPVPSSQITYDYQYYQARRDLIIMNKEGRVSSISGVPSSFPITPEVPANSMALASVYITPYPSLSPSYAQKINRRDLGCITTKLSNIRFTMRDIGVLKSRIENLEYYVSLNMLEKAAVDLKIRDEQGLERFKNGVFVDTFTNHSLGDTGTPEYRIVVDPEEKSIRPYFTMHSHYYDYLSGSSNIKRHGDIVTLNYTEDVLIEQPRATTNRNIELSSYRFIGNLYLYPDTEVWCETDTLADEIIHRDLVPDGVKQGSNPNWNDWQDQITGRWVQKSNDINNKISLYKPDDPNAWGPSQPFTGSPQSLVVDNGKVGGIDTFNTTSGYISMRDYRITQTKQSTRTGTQTTTTINTDTENIGERIVDVSLVAYMKSTRILCEARGLKARTRMYAFFDGENVNEFIRPLTASQFTALLNKPESYTNIQKNLAALGSQLTTDANGTAYFLFIIPKDTFRVGSRELVLTDSITNSVDASTYAKRQYVAHGIIQQKQNTILSTRHATITTKPITETANTIQYIYVNNPSCAAYSFLPKAPTDEEGIFMTSVDLFFSAVHPTLGVWVEIREMDNAGGITRNQVPFSEVWITADQIKPFLSSDSSKAYNIKFPAPVFLLNDVQYAFVIHTEGLNPDTYFWVSRLGETDILTNTKVTSRARTGTFYTTNNNLNWDMVPDVDLKIRFYRAAFNVNSPGEVILGNKPFENLNLSNVSSVIADFGETFLGTTRLTLSGNVNMITSNSRLIGVTSGANSEVLSINGSVAVVTDDDFIRNERVSIVHKSNNVVTGNTSLITTKRTSNGTIEYFKTINNDNFAEFRDSSGYFYVSDIIRGIESGTSATVDSIDNQRYSTVDFEPSYLTFGKTSIRFQMQPTSNTGVLGSYVSVVDGDNYSFRTEQALLSRSNELALLGGDRSNKIKTTMSTRSEYMSPVLDLARTHTVFVDNIINANTQNETGVNRLKIEDANGAINVGNVIVGSTSRRSGVVEIVDGTTDYIMSTSGFISGERVLVYNQSDNSFKGVVGNVSSNIVVKSVGTGQLLNKYINQPVVLATGQDAEDIRVICTAYRPPNSDIKVWVRFVHNEDSDSLRDRPWIEMEKLDNSVYSSLATDNDFKELTFNMPISSMTGPNGELQYVSSQGIRFTGYKSYQIKIGLLGTNSAIVPRVADLRVLCLQM